MTGLTVAKPFLEETKFVVLAREIATDFLPLDVILKNHNVDMTEWEKIRRNKQFQNLLEAETLAWNSALNTHERTKLKAAALVEEYLPEANARLHDKSENLNHKVELVKTLSRIAGMGVTGANIEGAPGEKFSITINIGDRNMKIEKEVTPQVIEGEFTEAK